MGSILGHSVYAKPPHILRPGGSIASLREHLADRGLGNLVTVFVGDVLEFKAGTKYRFIYCDASHDLAEVQRNIPTLGALMDRENCIFVCDDIKTPEMCAAVLDLLRADDHRLYGDFLVARFGSAVDR
jgi:hypothetical protein